MPKNIYGNFLLTKSIFKCVINQFLLGAGNASQKYR